MSLFDLDAQFELKLTFLVRSCSRVPSPVPVPVLTAVDRPRRSRRRHHRGEPLVLIGHRDMFCAQKESGGFTL